MQLSEQMHLSDTIAGCWDVKQATHSAFDFHTRDNREGRGLKEGPLLLGELQQLCGFC